MFKHFAIDTIIIIITTTTITITMTGGEFVVTRLGSLQNFCKRLLCLGIFKHTHTHTLYFCCFQNRATKVLPVAKANLDRSCHLKQITNEMTNSKIINKLLFTELEVNNSGGY